MSRAVEFRGGPLDGQYQELPDGHPSVLRLAMLKNPRVLTTMEPWPTQVEYHTGTYAERLTRDGILMEWQGWGTDG